MKIWMENTAGTHTYGANCIFYLPGDDQSFGADSSDYIFESLESLRLYALEKGDVETMAEAKRLFNKKWAKSLSYKDY
jgi:hypothetical protein